MRAPDGIERAASGKRPPGRWRRGLVQVLATVLLLVAGAGAAIAEDVEGSADHPLIPRYDGSEIVKYEHESFADYPILTAPLAEYGGIEDNPGAVLEFEGELTRLTYRAPAKRSVLEVFRNYEQALAEAGFETVFTCEKKECGASDFGDFAERDRSMTIWGDGSSHRYLSARLPRDEGDVYASLYVTENASGGPSKGRAMIQLDVVEIEPMEERMVVVKSSDMERALATEGRIALYGILFDFDKDTMRPDSKPQLDEIGKLLSENPEIEVLVVGHTDGRGALDYNLDLSERRARSVVEALVRDYGTERGRLTPVGVGMAAPVATNRTEEGRAKNRRVELVERTEGASQ